MAQTNVKGLAELNKYLQTLPAKMEANVMRSGMGAGANVLVKEAKSRAPVGEPSKEGRKKYKLYAGALRDSIRKSSRIKFGTVMVSIKAGGKNKKTGANVYYAHMIEWGTKAHTISARKGSSLSFGKFFGQSVKHPGIKPRPFMRPALDIAHRKAVMATAKAIKNRLAKKHGIDTPHIKLEGDE